MRLLLKILAHWRWMRSLKAPRDPQHAKRRHIELQVQRGMITTIKSKELV